MEKNRYISNVNWGLVTISLALVVLGTVNLYSATVAREKFSVYYIYHMYWFMLGLFLAILINIPDYRKLLDLTYIIYGIVLLLLVIVAFKGKTVMGGRRWISLGFISIQPSEFMKLALIMALAQYYNTRKTDGPYGWVDLWKPLMMIALPVALTLKQPDLGTAMIIAITGFSMMIFAKMRMWVLGPLTIFGIGGSVLLWSRVLKSYQKKRIDTFLNPNADLLGSGYHANQSTIAVGSGKGVGKGFMASTQSQFSFLPEQHTDFIFSVFSEEWGLAGVLLVLALFAVLLGIILEVARNAKDKFGVFVCIGVFFMLFAHLTINVGMVSGLLPVVGVTLPFFSSGGSSLITVMCAIAMVNSISRRRYTYRG